MLGKVRRARQGGYNVCVCVGRRERGGGVEEKDTH